MHVNEGCGFLVHGNNGLQMRMFFRHVLHVHLIEMNNKIGRKTSLGPSYFVFVKF
jgi:hypothetical protein